MSLFKNYTIKWTRKCHSDKTNELLIGHFFLALPHVTASLIFIMLFPEKWVGILILGVFLSDLSLGIHNFIKFKFPKISFFREYGDGSRISNINHTILVSAVLIVLFLREYALFYSGLAHLLIDWIVF